MLGWSAEQVLNILFEVSGRDPVAEFHMQRYDRLRALAASRPLEESECEDLQESLEAGYFGCHRRRQP